MPLALRAWGIGAPSVQTNSVRVLSLSHPLRVAVPPLFVCSMPKRAVGFSFPRGLEGKVLGASVMGVTVAVTILLATAYGPLAGALMVWLAGGTAGLIIYNSTRQGLAFVKQSCSACRLRPIIEEHEMMHLNGEPSEQVIWAEAKKKYSYEGLGLGTDPKICAFCPIAKRLKET